MGGVYNAWYTGVNIDLNTGKKLTIEDVMDMSTESVYECIAMQLEEDYDIEYHYALEKVRALETIPFWFDGQRVFLWDSSPKILTLVQAIMLWAWNIKNMLIN